MSKKPKLTVVVDKENPQADGRRQRSQRSREKILRAYWELMLDGDMEPERGCNRRTCWRWPKVCLPAFRRS